MPSEEWKNGVGSALTSYAADPTDANWAKVATAFVDGWAKKKLQQQNKNKNVTIKIVI